MRRDEVCHVRVDIPAFSFSVATDAGIRKGTVSLLVDSKSSLCFPHIATYPAKPEPNGKNCPPGTQELTKKTTLAPLAKFLGSDFRDSGPVSSTG